MKYECLTLTSLVSLSKSTNASMSISLITTQNIHTDSASSYAIVKKICLPVYAAYEIAARERN